MLRYLARLGLYLFIGFLRHKLLSTISHRIQLYFILILSLENFADYITFILSDVIANASFSYTAISINVVRSKPKTYETRASGGLGIHWDFAYWPKENVQVCIFARKNLSFLSGGLFL